MSQLVQLIGYLERPGVTEVVIGVGRPIAMRNATGLTDLTARPISSEQLASMLRGSPIENMIPDEDATTDPVDIQVGSRRVRVQVGRRGSEVLVRLTRPEEAAPIVTQPMARVAQPRAGTERPVENLRPPRPPAEPEVKFKGSTAPLPREPAPPSPAYSPTIAAPSPIAPRPPAIAQPVEAPSPPAQTSPSKTDPSAISLDSIALDFHGELEISGVALPPPRKQTVTAQRPHVAPAPAAARPRAPSVPPPLTGLELDLDPLDPPGLPGSPSPLAPSGAFGPAGGAFGPPSGALAPPPGMPIDVDGPTQAPGPGFMMPTEMVLDDVGYGAPSASSPAPFSPPPAAYEPSPYAPPPPPPPPPAPAPPILPSGPLPVVRAPVATEPTQPHRLPSLSTTQPIKPGPFADLVKVARDHGASDLHISSGRATALRLGSELVPIGNGPLSAAEVDALLVPLLDDEMRQTLDKVGYVDFALGAPGSGRLRVNICRQQLGLKGTFRLAMKEPASLEQLGLPSDLARVVSHHQGLVIVAGPSGHGKTTTLAALVDLVNSTRAHHILTIEDPVEIIHTRKLAVISQREVGRHTESFARGLKASLREDPDVIVIGELRDRESVEIALTAAETGHLVLATMSTPSAAKTIDRLIDMFPPEEHSQVRASVAGALRAIVAQRLLPRKGGRGVVPAVELVTGVLPLAVMIREDKLYQLPNLMQRGRAFGMIRLEESIAELVRLGRIEDDPKTQPMWRTPK